MTIRDVLFSNILAFEFSTKNFYTFSYIIINNKMLNIIQNLQAKIYLKDNKPFKLIFFKITI